VCTSVVVGPAGTCVWLCCKAGLAQQQIRWQLGWPGFSLEKSRWFSVAGALAVADGEQLNDQTTECNVLPSGFIITALKGQRDR
jgi:hypothetical protein